MFLRGQSFGTLLLFLCSLSLRVLIVTVSHTLSVPAASQHRNTAFGRYLRPLTHNAALVFVKPTGTATGTGTGTDERAGEWMPARVLAVGPNSTLESPTALVAILRPSPAGAIGEALLEVCATQKWSLAVFRD